MKAFLSKLFDSKFSFTLRKKFDVTNNVTIRNTDIFSITVRVELFFISDVNNALPPVVVKPFIKKYFTGSGWKIYASVTYLSKPVYNLSVNARIRGPDGSSHELLLSDIPEGEYDFQINCLLKVTQLGNLQA